MDLARTSGAHVRGEHDHLEAAADSRDVGFAYREEMRSEAADGLFENDLEESAGDEGIGKAEEAEGGISETADAGVDLADEDYADRDEGAHDAGG